MKHTVKITWILVFIFLAAQIMGLFIINSYIDYGATGEKGVVVVRNLPYGMERPPIEQESSFLLFMMSAIFIGTFLLLMLIKLRKVFIWKIWYFTAVVLCLAIAFSAFINSTIAFLLALVLSIFKVFKPSLLIHNMTEIFVYGGIAAIFVLIPAVNVMVGFGLLILISLYDMYAVWKSKHMIKLAKFTNESKTFAGLSIPYKLEKAKGKKTSKKGKGVLVRGERKVAVLGGGDIAFPLIFAGAVMKDLMLTNSIIVGFMKTLIIPLFVTVALFLLFVKGKKDKFYPAMPYLSAGCFVGYFFVWLSSFI
jgi:presenilin-like A22 family membrane protease